jgi:hypothetical protein
MLGEDCLSATQLKDVEILMSKRATQKINKSIGQKEDDVPSIQDTLGDDIESS